MSDDRPTQPPPPPERPDWVSPESWRDIEPELQRWHDTEQRALSLRDQCSHETEQRAALLREQSHERD